MKHSTTTTTPQFTQTFTQTSAQSSTSRPNHQPQRNRPIHKHLCHLHAGKGRILPHNDIECMHPDNPRGVNYKQEQTNNTTSYTRPKATNYKPIAALEHPKPSAASSMGFFSKQPRSEFDQHSEHQVDEDIKEGKPETIVDSGADPTHTPTIPPKSMHTNIRTTIANEDEFRITHHGRLKIRTANGAITTKCVTTPDNKHTLLSVRQATDGHSITFTKDKVFRATIKRQPTY